jgi:ABC-type antimicrobial peptide transport system ATPase subunit
MAGTWKAGLSSGLNSNPEELTNSLFLIPKLIMVEFDGRLLVPSEASHLIAVTAHNFIRILRSLNQPKLSSVLLSSFLLTPYTNWISFYVCVTKYIGSYMKKTALTPFFSFIPDLQLNYKYMMDCKSYFLPLYS